MNEFLSLTKALADETRVRALLTLKGGELCLCQIIEILGLDPSTVSKHMSLLQVAGLIERRKEGKWAFYRLTDGNARPSARRALDWALAALENDPAIKADARRAREVRREDLEELSACYRG